MLLLAGTDPARWQLLLIAAGTYLVALLMVSTVRYWSFKEVHFVQRRPVETLLIVVLAVMIIAARHELFSFAVFAAYVVSGPVTYLMVGRQETQAPEPERREARG